MSSKIKRAAEFWTRCSGAIVACGRPASAAFQQSSLDITVASNNPAQSEYKHVLASILRSLFVARTPSEEARSPGRRSNVENTRRRGPITGELATPTYRIWRNFENAPSPDSQRPAARADPAQPAVRTMWSYRGMDASL